MKKETCLRCGHDWYKRTPKKPKVCPKCKTPYWDSKKLKTKVKKFNQ